MKIPYIFAFSAMLLMGAGCSSALPDNQEQPVAESPSQPQETTEKETLPDVAVTKLEVYNGGAYSLSYPSDWSAITNEVGGLQEIRQPEDDHAVISVRYVDAREDTQGCNLLSNPSYQKTETLSKQPGFALVSYTGTNKLGVDELAVSIEESVEDSVWRCTILERNDAWIIHDQLVADIMNSVKLNF